MNIDNIKEAERISRKLDELNSMVEEMKKGHCIAFESDGYAYAKTQYLKNNLKILSTVRMIILSEINMEIQELNKLASTL